LKELRIEVKRSCRSLENGIVEIEDDEMITRCNSQADNIVPYIVDSDYATPLTLDLLSKLHSHMNSSQELAHSKCRSGNEHVTVSDHNVLDGTSRQSSDLLIKTFVDQKDV
jgi:hypothetical protein